MYIVELCLSFVAFGFGLVLIVLIFSLGVKLVFCFYVCTLSLSGLLLVALGRLFRLLL